MSSYKPNTHVKPSADLQHAAIQVFDEVWHQFLRDFQPKFIGRVLDVGCGDGAITSLCKEQLFFPGIKWSGCDLSEKMVEFCVKKWPGIDFFKLDICADIDHELVNKYDGIFSEMILHHISEHRKPLENFHKLLDKDGFLFCSFYPNMFCYDIHKEILKRDYREWTEYLKDRESFVNPYQELDPVETEVQFRKLLADVGFKNIHTKLVRMKCSYPNLDHCKGAIRATDAFYPRIEESKAERYLDDIISISVEEHLLPEYPEKPILDNPDLPLYCIWTILAVTAEK